MQHRVTKISKYFAKNKTFFFQNVMFLCLALFQILSFSLCINIVPPDADLKLKILELQKSGKRDKRQSQLDDHIITDIRDPEPGKYIDRFGNKINSNEAPVEDKKEAERPRVIKLRKKARFPRRSYGSDYERPSKKKKKSKKFSAKRSYAAPRSSYDSPTIDVSTHRPSYSTKPPAYKKKEPFTSFRSISSAKSSTAPPPYSTPAPSSYASPSPSHSSYSAPSSSSYSAPSQGYSSPSDTSYSAPDTGYSAPTERSVKPPTNSYSSPKQSYSSPKQSYSSPKQSYSSPKQSYSSPKQSYSSPKQSYSSPKQSYSSPKSYSVPSYSSDENTPSEYSWSYAVPETELQAWEKRSGYSTEGSYSVLLPDGRTMTVTYSVPDTETGFLAEVTINQVFCNIFILHF